MVTPRGLAGAGGGCWGRGVTLGLPWALKGQCLPVILKGFSLSPSLLLAFSLSFSPPATQFPGNCLCLDEGHFLLESEMPGTMVKKKTEKRGGGKKFLSSYQQQPRLTCSMLQLPAPPGIRFPHYMLHLSFSSPFPCFPNVLPLLSSSQNLLSRKYLGWMQFDSPNAPLLLCTPDPPPPFFICCC